VFLSFHDFQFSCHIPCPRVEISFFQAFSIFPDIFHILKGVFLIFHLFSYLAILQVLKCAFIFFHVFQYILSYLTTQRVLFSFSVILSFLAIFQVLQCAFLIFHVFQWFCHFSSRQVDVSHFPWFSVFLPYSMSYSGHS
jgi:hypothetical protein